MQSKSYLILFEYLNFFSTQFEIFVGEASVRVEKNVPNILVK